MHIYGKSHQILIVASILSLLIVCSIFLYNHLAVPRIASSFTIENFFSLRPGMPCDKAIEMLGEPLRKRNYELLDKNDHTIQYSGLSYGLTGLIGDQYEIGVGCKEGIIDRVGIELDDYNVYFCDRKECPQIYKPEMLDSLKKYID